MKFQSKHQLFELYLSDEWKYDFKDNVYSFYNSNEVEGVLQISAYWGEKGKVSKFDPTEELQKEQYSYPSAQLVKVSEYDAVHFGLKYDTDNLLDYRWIIGNKNIKLFCTLLLNSDQKEEVIDKSYEKVVTILNSLKINNEIIKD